MRALDVLADVIAVLVWGIVLMSMLTLVFVF